MKKLFTTSVLLLLTIAFLSGCKKDKGTDYAAAIKDKVWVGIFNYKTAPDQFYSIHFKADGSLVFSEFRGDYNGTWKMDGKQLSITIGAKVSANISEDNKLIDIVNDANNDWELKTGELNSNPDIALVGTTWKGLRVADEVIFSFKPGSMVDATRANNSMYSGDYTRTGAGVRFGGGSGYFYVIMPNGKEMKGGYSGMGWEAWVMTKQN